MSEVKQILQFLRSVAHDVKTPLNGMLALLDLIDCSELGGQLEEEPQSELQADLSEIQKQSRTLKRYLETIFDYAKHRVGDFELASYPSSLSLSLLAVLGELVTPHDTDRSLTVFIGAEQLNKFQFDSARVELAFGNLLAYLLRETKGSKHGVLVIAPRGACGAESVHSFGLGVMLDSPEHLLSHENFAKKFVEDDVPTTLSQSMHYQAELVLCAMRGVHRRTDLDGLLPMRIYDLPLALPRKLSQELLMTSFLQKLTDQPVEFGAASTPLEIKTSLGCVELHDWMNRGRFFHFGAKCKDEMRSVLQDQTSKVLE